jgi:hypothetical protein
LANAIPEGYVGIHVPRVGRRGGGMLSFTVQRSVSIVSPLLLSHHFLST